MTYSIRAARRADVERLAAVERAAASRFRGLRVLDEAALAATLSPSDLASHVEAGRAWVATRDDDTPIGFAVAARIGDDAHLLEVDVVPAAAGHGLGGRLIEAVAAWAHAAGFTRLTLTTFRDVPWNAPYYARLGFRVLADDELTPALRALSAAEAAAGLEPKLRVCMARTLPARP